MLALGTVHVVEGNTVMHIEDSQLAKELENPIGYWPTIAGELKVYYQAKLKDRTSSDVSSATLGGGIILISSCLSSVWFGSYGFIVISCVFLLVALILRYLFSFYPKILSEYEWTVKECGVNKEVAIFWGVFKELIDERVRMYECTFKDSSGTEKPSTYFVVRLDSDGNPTGKEWSDIAARAVKLDQFYETPLKKKKVD